MAIKTVNTSSAQVNFGTWNVPEGTSNFSMCGFFKFNVADTRQMLFGKNNGTGNSAQVWSFHTDELNVVSYKLQLNGTTTSISSSANAYAVDGNYYFLAMTYNGSTITAYLNGTVVGSVNRTGTVTNNDFGVVYNGRAGLPGIRRFDGCGEDIRVYTRTLSDKELSQIQNSFGQDFLYSDMQFWLRFDERNTGTVVESTTGAIKDHGPFSYHGTCSNTENSAVYELTSRNYRRRLPN